MESPRPCPNCGSQVPLGAALCPNCGATLLPAPPQPVWPPPPGSVPPPMPPAPKLVTGSAAGDVILGIVLALVACFLAGVGFIAAPILYAVLRPTRPFFARGLGYGALVGVALLLGAVGLCFYSIFHENA